MTVCDDQPNCMAQLNILSGRHKAIPLLLSVARGSDDEKTLKTLPKIASHRPLSTAKTMLLLQ